MAEKMLHRPIANRPGGTWGNVMQPAAQYRQMAQTLF